jgi:hypothetical protein
MPPTKMHLPPVQRKPREDSGDAFFPDPAGGPAHTKDDLAEELAEEFIASATSGEGQGEEGHERVVAEETGGPFVPSTGKVEFGRRRDASNPRGATREPFPTPSSPKK